jgi:hypothetical protein
VSFDVCHLSRSKFDVTNDSPSKKQKCSEGKPQKKSYNNIKKFETKWAAKVPWVEGVMSKDGMINLVKCEVCYLILKKEKIMGCKWDTLVKHQGH